MQRRLVENMNRQQREAKAEAKQAAMIERAVVMVGIAPPPPLQ
jgi:hypothetical protein